MNVLLGSKYQYYIDDEINVVRLCAIKNENTFVCMDKNDNKIIVTEKQLTDMVKLIPDAVLTIMSTVDDNNQGVSDVYACVNKLTDESDIPCVILRQGMYSITKNSFNFMPNEDMYVGDCFCSKNYPSENGIEELLEFTDIKNTTNIALYIDDKLDDIFKCIGKHTKKFDEVLFGMKSESDKLSNGMVKGYCTKLRDLFEENNFMFNFRLAFNINQIDFEVELDDGSNVKDGVITFNNKQKKLFEDLIRQYITDVKILKYDNDIDISKIVSHTHLVVSDKNDNIYIVAYTVVDNYPVDDDIASAMKVSNK